MGRGLHKNWSHSEKRKRYLERSSKEGYPRGGYNNPPDKPYAPPKRRG